MSKTYTYEKTDTQNLSQKILINSNNASLEKVIIPFYEECYSGNLKSIELLISKNSSSPEFTNAINSIETLFYIINGNGSTKEKEDIMSYLKKENLLDLNLNNGYALEIAVQKDDVPLVQFLMNNEVKMNSYDDGILLYYAAQKNDYDMFFLLRNNGIDIDSELLKDIRDLELSGDMKVAIDHFNF